MSKDWQQHAIATMADTVAGLRKSLAEKVKQYEVKLATINTINSALQSENDELRRQLEAAEAPKTDTEVELDELREEFARRLGGHDRTIADLKGAREELLYKVEEYSGKEEKLKKSLADKEKEVDQLKSEVGKLKEAQKTFDSTYHHAQTAKDEAEGEKEFLRGRAGALQIELENAQTQVQALQSDLNASKKVSELTAATAESRILALHEQAAESAREKENVLLANLKNMQADSDRLLLEWEEREKNFKAEIVVLEHRLHDLESEKLDLQSQASDCTRPLLKQLESLMAASEQQQLEAQDALEKLQDDLSNSITKAAALQREVHEANEHISVLESELKGKSEAVETCQQAAAQSGKRADRLHTMVLDLETELNMQKQQMASERQEALHYKMVGDKARMELSEKLNVSDQECERLRSSTKLLKTQLEASQEKLESLQQPVTQNQPPNLKPTEGPKEPHVIPNAAISKADSAFDDEFENMFRPVEELGKSHGRLKDRKMDAMAKQLELLERGRHQLTKELQAVVGRAEAAEGALIELQGRLAEFEEHHGVALELLGERNERVEQLELDIVEMKDIFHQQLEVCVEQLNSLKSGNGGDRVD